jgi:membrane protease subunit HflK
MASRGFGGGHFDRDEFPWERIVKVAPLVLLLGFILPVGWKGFYTVQAHEQAVVLRFGRHHATTGPGLHFMIPLADRAVPVSVEEHRLRLPFGESSEEPRAMRSRDGANRDEPLMLTGDLSAAVVEWTVQWQVVDPAKFLFQIDNDPIARGSAGSVSHINATIQAVAQSVMHRLVGDYSIDEMLTEKRDEVRLSAEKAGQALLDKYDCGIQITGLQMQRVTPPGRVKPSFDAVNTSLQNKEKLVNESKTERNKLIPQARASKDKLIQEAKGYADRRRLEAQGEISALLAKYEAYRQAPDVTRRRLYIEAMEEVLAESSSKTILDSDLQGLLPMLQVGSEDNPTASPRRKEGQK